MATAPGTSPDLARVVGAVRCLAPELFAIDGVTVTVDPGRTTPAGDPRLEALATEIYERLYIRAAPPATTRRAGDAAASRDHVLRLSAANSGRGTWEPGWRIEDLEPGGDVVVRKAGLSFLSATDRVRPEDGVLEPGRGCRVRVEKELWDHDGFYMALGDAEEPAKSPVVVRLYWHLTVASAVPFVAGLTSRLNPEGVPFQAKLPRHPRDYDRTDAGVVYFDKRHREAVLDAAGEVYAELAPSLREVVPLFTKRLAPGLAVAEDPGDGLSFGRHRSELIAAALWRAHDAAAQDAERTKAVADAFTEAGLDPRRPYLVTADSEDVYEPLDPVAVRRPRRRRTPRTDPLEAAARIGDRLCREAWWHDGRANWMGRSASRKGVAAALGADLYAGSAGVGLFLARLAALTGDALHRRTAAGALWQALTAADRTPPPRALAFFTGQAGVAWAAWRGGEHRDDATALLDRLRAATDAEHLLDLVDGNAGTITAFLDLARDPALPAALREHLLAVSAVLGEELATEIADGGGWASPRASGEAYGPPLTGLSHGAAGMALALLELAVATGREGFRARGRQGFAYEDALFDPERGNWPDLRRETGDRGDTPPRFPVLWCHGAPGIVLSRLRAAVVDPERAPDYRAAARAGVETTSRALAAALVEDGADTCLCHGATGLAEVLLTAGRELGETRFVEQAREAMNELATRHGAGPWPSGTASRGPNPSLFLGDAGVGWTLLRLDAPEEVPSVLLLRT